MTGAILLALGSNLPGAWGEPAETIRRCVEALGDAGLEIAAVSGIYETKPVGPGQGANFANAVVAGDSHLAPQALLRVLKRLERRAGTRSAMPWGPRTLDIDILSYKDRVIGWRSRAAAGRGCRSRRRLVIPHPLLHTRPFVLRPLLDVAPAWRHPVLDRTARQLWKVLSPKGAGRVVRRIDAPGQGTAAAALAMPRQSA